MEDNSAKRSKNFSKQELEVLVEEMLWWTLIFSPPKQELQQSKLLYPLKTLYPPHIELEVQQNRILKKSLRCHN
ncbi:unnamed protein product [Boreogadus saida]